MTTFSSLLFTPPIHPFLPLFPLLTSLLRAIHIRPSTHSSHIHSCSRLHCPRSPLLSFRNSILPSHTLFTRSVKPLYTTLVFPIVFLSHFHLLNSSNSALVTISPPCLLFSCASRILHRFSVFWVSSTFFFLFWRDSCHCHGANDPSAIPHFPCLHSFSDCT